MKLLIRDKLHINFKFTNSCRLITEGLIVKLNKTSWCDKLLIHTR